MHDHIELRAIYDTLWKIHNGFNYYLKENQRMHTIMHNDIDEPFMVPFERFTMASITTWEK